MFHTIRDKDWFERVVLLLGKKYKFVSADDVEDYYYKSKNLKNACLLTVDDGDLTSFEVIYPVLKKHNVPGVFFVSPKISRRDGMLNFWFQEIENCDKDKLLSYFKETSNRGIRSLSLNRATFNDMPVDEIIERIEEYKFKNNISPLPPQNMNEEHIKLIDAEGLVKIGAHTMTHPFLSYETDERSKSEIKDSLLDLENMLGHPIKYFAYPNGLPNEDFGQREIDILKKTKCRIAFSTQYKNFSKRDNPYSIPRFGVTYGNENFIMMKLLLGKYYPKIKKIITALG